MDSTSSSLGGSSVTNQGLMAPQNNLQPTGSQNQGSSQSSLQQPTANILNNQNLQLTDENGHVLALSTSTTSIAPAKTTTPTHHNYGLLGLSVLIIIVVFAGTWFSTRQKS